MDYLATIPSDEPIEFTTLAESYSLNCYLNWPNNTYVQYDVKIGGSTVQTLSSAGEGYSDSKVSSSTTVELYASNKSGGAFKHWSYSVNGGAARTSNVNPFKIPDSIGNGVYIQSIDVELIGQKSSENNQWTLEEEEEEFNISSANFDIYLDRYILYRFKISFQTSGNKTFASTGDCRHTLYLTDDTGSYDSLGNILSNDLRQVSTTSTNPSLTYNVTANTTYYLWVRHYNATDAGNISISVGNDDNSPTISSLSAVQAGGALPKVVVTWSGTNLKGGTYSVVAGTLRKAFGTMDQNSKSVEITLDRFTTYTITVSVTKNDTTVSQRVDIKLNEVYKPEPWVWPSEFQTNKPVIEASHYDWNKFIGRIMNWVTYKGFTDVLTSSDFGRFSYLYNPSCDQYNDLLQYAFILTEPYELTAEKFNIAKFVINKMSPTEPVSFTDRSSGDKVYADYFHKLADALNSIPE
jgi:hypothetical protein